MDFQTLQDDVYKVIRRFYEAFQVEGFVKLYLTLDDKEDSDGNSIYNAYLMPLDDTAKRCFKGKGSLHLQLLGDMLPATLLNNSYKAELSCPKGNFIDSRFNNVHVQMSHVQVAQAS